MSVVTVSVTQGDICSGVREDCNKCPVARAISRHFPGKWVSVTGDAVSIYNEYNPEEDYYTSCEAYYYLPDSVNHFVSNFDEGNPVAPFEFVIDTDENNEEDYLDDFDD
jgi:hypothetical protein